MPKRGRSSAKPSPKGQRVKLAEQTPVTEAPKPSTDANANPSIEAASISVPEGAEDFTISLEDFIPARQDPIEPMTSKACGDPLPQAQEEDLVDYDDFDLLPTTTSEDFNDEILLASDAYVEKGKIIAPTAQANEVNDEFDTSINDDTLREAEATLKAREDEETEKKLAAEEILEGGKNCLIQGLQSSFLYVPTLQSSLGLKDVGDNVAAKFNSNGFEFEVSLKVVSVQETPLVAEDDDEETHAFKGVASLPTTDEQPQLIIDTVKAQNALQSAPPLSAWPLSAGTRSKAPCKFGANCTKGGSCLFDHGDAGATKKKLCTWVNTLQGCTQGNYCQFSHNLEGVKCNKSKMRSMCLNSYKCAYRHDDDEVKRVKEIKPRMSNAAELAQKAALVRTSREASVASQMLQSYGSRPVSPTPPPNAPAGPKNATSLAQGAGRKRGRDDEGDHEDHKIQRVRNNHQLPHNRNLQQQSFSQYNGNDHAGTQQPGRGRGRGRGRVSGRGSARGGQRQNYSRQIDNSGAQQGMPKKEMNIKGFAGQGS